MTAKETVKKAVAATSGKEKPVAAVKAKSLVKREISSFSDAFRSRYDTEVRKALQKRFGYTNVMRIPRIAKITINRGIGEATENPKVIESSVEEIGLISGQKPVVTLAKKSIATFKIRKDAPVGVAVTLRSVRMYAFLEKLVTVVFERIRDFKGLSSKSFDGRGNYTFSLKEQLVFPEIVYDRVDKARGMSITITTTAQTDEECKALLEAFGVPFRQR
ncbi:MAG: 50S ribosomal protein L5 [Caldisericota bacterium]|jgi:large subunit ribosomal protein L5|nr:50S ribosomal protein L5 [Caldisericota bacterium]